MWNKPEYTCLGGSLTTCSEFESDYWGTRLNNKSQNRTSTIRQSLRRCCRLLGSRPTKLPLPAPPSQKNHSHQHRHHVPPPQHHQQHQRHPRPHPTPVHTGGGRGGAPGGEGRRQQGGPQPASMACQAGGGRLRPPPGLPCGLDPRVPRPHIRRGRPGPDPVTSPRATPTPRALTSRSPAGLPGTPRPRDPGPGTLGSPIPAKTAAPVNPPPVAAECIPHDPPPRVKAREVLEAERLLPLRDQQLQDAAARLDALRAGQAAKIAQEAALAKQQQEQRQRQRQRQPQQQH